MRYFIKTFGCQQNLADTERLSSYYESRGYKKAFDFVDADVVVINTCVVRQQAEERVYGLVNNLLPLKTKNPNFKIVVTGCLVGTALRDTTGVYSKILKERLPSVDEFLPINEVGFEYQAIRNDQQHAWIPITQGCNNFCTFCIVPFSRGVEISRPFQDVLNEVKVLNEKGYSEITFLGQNVNSYGSDIIKNRTEFILPDGKKIKPIMVKHLGKFRIPTLFPYLLNEVCKFDNIKKVSFISSNPWDFSNKLIEVIAMNKKVDRLIHLPVQSGDNKVLKKMNRWYTKEEYIDCTLKIKKMVPEASFSTDIIVGFPDESQDAFNNTVDLVKMVGFVKAYVACYSQRPGTLAKKKFIDNVPYEEKKRRFRILDNLINHTKHQNIAID